MELVFDVLDRAGHRPGQLRGKTFSQAGGVIGRATECDLSIQDSSRHLSGRHARVSYHDGSFYLTDISRNGIQLKHSGAYLEKGQERQIEDGEVYLFAGIELRASLRYQSSVHRYAAPLGKGVASDAYLDLDPLLALDQQESVYSELDQLKMTKHRNAASGSDHAPVFTESVPLPELVLPENESHVPATWTDVDGFWPRFGAELGVDLSRVDPQACEVIALKTARIIRQMRLSGFAATGSQVMSLIDELATPHGVQG